MRVFAAAATDEASSAPLWVLIVGVAMLVVALAGCGAKTALDGIAERDAGPGIDAALDGGRDASFDAPPDGGRDAGVDVGTDAFSPDRGCLPNPDGCEPMERCDGSDTDCDGRVDEG